MVTLQHSESVCVIVYCETDALANIYTWKSVVGMCLYWGKGSAVKVFAAPPLLIMIMRNVLSFGRVNKQASHKQARAWRTGMHQAQAGAG